ncbi:hypothetical protein E4L95_15790 [Paracoccus liaowanqingii]|uniref:Uncharacterized protein n=2 Tax=Paracoccus liaowanqingii TaxID=2560053 RepID=A0A4Z1C6V7_9RHOB|nr:hypothetical protein E4L95_15790 [Paracoccus liaowanqingii]
MMQIAHNRGPALDSTGWRSHCWTRARRDLLPVLPIKVVRLRVRRAQALGLDYKTYAGVRATTGRDLIAFLFSSNALGVFRDGQDPAPGRGARLIRLEAARHLGAGPGLDMAALAGRIDAASALRLPDFGAPWSGMRDRMKGWIATHRLPGDAVLMVSETDHERDIMAAAGLAGFVSGQRYFEGQSHEV